MTRLPRSGAMAPLAAVALIASACGSEAPGELMPFAACVLQGSAVSDGCAVDDRGRPSVLLGTVSFGRQVSRVIALRDAREGSSTEVTEVSLQGSVPSTLQLSLFTADGASETPVTLPFSLAPQGGGANTELRVRVTFTADTPGAIPEVQVKAAAGDRTLSIPVTGMGLDRVTGAFAGVGCSGSYYCSTAAADLCAVLPDLRPGEAFAVKYSNVGSSWSSSHVATTQFAKGTAFTYLDAMSGSKRNTTGLVYDGACSLTAYSAYSGSSTDYYQCVVQLLELAYVIP